MSKLASRPWLSRSWRVVRALLLVYLVLVLILSLAQGWLIFPGAATQGQRHAIVRPMPGTELVKLRTGTGDTVVALFGRAMTADGADDPDAAARPTVLFFYGNGMCMADALGEFNDFRRLGANAAVMDYPGYGMSSGRPGEAAIYAAAEALYDHVAARPDVDATKIVPMGWSLGSGPAIELATRRPVAGVATFSAFTRMADMARRTLPVFPTSVMLRHKFDNLAKVPGLRMPIFIAHGTDDSIIPASMSEQLAEAAAGNLAAHLRVAGADHNDFFEVGGDELLRELGQFLRTAAARSRPTATNAADLTDD